MSNYIKITRAARSIEAWDPHDSAITREEWLALASADLEMRVLPAGPMPLPWAAKHAIRRPDDVVLWSATGAFDGESAVWFCYEERGFIQVKPVGDGIARKLSAVARQLNARAIGEDDEQHDEGEVVESSLSQSSTPKSWLQKLLGR